MPNASVNTAVTDYSHSVRTVPGSQSPNVCLKIMKHSTGQHVETFHRDDT
jgi:hypothetical protein